MIKRLAETSTEQGRSAAPRQATVEFWRTVANLSLKLVSPAEAWRATARSGSSVFAEKPEDYKAATLPRRPRSDIEANFLELSAVLIFSPSTRYLRAESLTAARRPGNGAAGGARRRMVAGSALGRSALSQNIGRPQSRAQGSAWTERRLQKRRRNNGLQLIEASKRPNEERHENDSSRRAAKKGDNLSLLVRVLWHLEALLAHKQQFPAQRRLHNELEQPSSEIVTLLLSKIKPNKIIFQTIIALDANDVDACSLRKQLRQVQLRLLRGVREAMRRVKERNVTISTCELPNAFATFLAQVESNA